MRGGWESQAEEEEEGQDGALTRPGAHLSLLGSLSNHLAAPFQEGSGSGPSSLQPAGPARRERPYLPRLCSPSRKEVAPVACGWDIPWLGLLFPDFS